MKIIHKKDVIHVNKPEGTSVDYYLHKEYELHFNRPLRKLASLRNFLVLSKIYRITFENLALAKLKKFEVNFTKNRKLQ